MRQFQGQIQKKTWNDSRFPGAWGKNSHYLKFEAAAEIRNRTVAKTRTTCTVKYCYSKPIGPTKIHYNQTSLYLIPFSLYYVPLIRK